MQIAEALRLLRIRQGLTQTAASKREGAPDYRTLSQWESSRKLPSLKILVEYLKSLELDFYDLQEAMDQVAGRPTRPVRLAMEAIRDEVTELGDRVSRLEVGAGKDARVTEG